MLPSADRCSVCATAHLPAEPHNAMSLYYQMAFRLQHGRWPTWEDAMTHCDPDVREIWTEELIAVGAMSQELLAWSQTGQSGMGDHEEVMDGR